MCHNFLFVAILAFLVVAEATFHSGGSRSHFPYAKMRSPRERGCIHMHKHYNNGDQIKLSEPCLICSCTNSMLKCYLRVCPSLKNIGSTCYAEEVAGECCPRITCPNAVMRPEEPETTTTGTDTTTIEPNLYKQSEDEVDVFNDNHKPKNFSLIADKSRESSYVYTRYKSEISEDNDEVSESKFYTQTDLPSPTTLDSITQTEYIQIQTESIPIHLFDLTTITSDAVATQTESIPIEQNQITTTSTVAPIVSTNQHTFVPITSPSTTSTTTKPTEQSSTMFTTSDPKTTITKSQSTTTTITTTTTTTTPRPTEQSSSHTTVTMQTSTSPKMTTTNLPSTTTTTTTPYSAVNEVSTQSVILPLPNQIQPNQLYVPSWSKKHEGVGALSKSDENDDEGAEEGGSDRVDEILDGIIHALDKRLHTELPAEPREPTVLLNSAASNNKNNIVPAAMPVTVVPVNVISSSTADVNPTTPPTVMMRRPAMRREDDSAYFVPPPNSLITGYITNLNSRPTHMNGDSGSSTGQSQPNPPMTVKVSSMIGFNNGAGTAPKGTGTSSFMVVDDNEHEYRKGSVIDDNSGVEIITAKTPFLTEPGPKIGNSDSFLVNLSPPSLSFGASPSFPSSQTQNQFTIPKQPAFEHPLGPAWSSTGNNNNHGTSNNHNINNNRPPAAVHFPKPTYYQPTNQWKIVSQNSSPSMTRPLVTPHVRSQQPTLSSPNNYNPSSNRDDLYYTSPNNQNQELSRRSGLGPVGQFPGFPNVPNYVHGPQRRYPAFPLDPHPVPPPNSMSKIYGTHAQPPLTAPISPERRNEPIIPRPEQLFPVRPELRPENRPEMRPVDLLPARSDPMPITQSIPIIIPPSTTSTSVTPSHIPITTSMPITTAMPITSSTSTESPKTTSTTAANNNPWDLLRVSGCNIYGTFYKVDETITELSSACKKCFCSTFGVQCSKLC